MRRRTSYTVEPLGETGVSGRTDWPVHVNDKQPPDRRDGVAHTKLPPDHFTDAPQVVVMRQVGESGGTEEAIFRI